MNYCLLLSNSVVNMLLFAGKSSIVNHAGSCSTGTAYQAKPSGAETAPGTLGPDPGFVFGSEQKKTTGDVPVLAGAHPQGPGNSWRCTSAEGSKGTLPAKTRGCKLASPQSLLKPEMATNPRQGREHLRCPQLQTLNHSKRLISDTIQLHLLFSS